MRHPLVPAAVVLVLLAAYALAGVVHAGNAAAGDAVTVEGTVTGTDGAATSDAKVLIGDYAMLAKLTPSELRDAADANRSDLTVLAVGPDGAFGANVPAARADGAVALSDHAISETVRLGDQGAMLSLRLHERRPQSVRAAAAPAGPGEVTRLHVDLHNNGDHAVESLSVTLTALPDGWHVVASDTDGTYDSERRTLAWASVPAGDAAGATLTVAVPEDVPVGAYGIGLRAGSDTTQLSAEYATVEVREATPGPAVTRTASGGGEGTTSETPETATPSPTGTSVPGFGFAVALVALAAAARALRGDRR